jgi:glycosyltransferase involved in cell wall biosynthesis
MRILFLSYRPPYPPTSGERLRTFQQLTLLAENHEVAVAAFVNSPQQSAQLEQLRVFDIKTYEVPINIWISKVRALCALMYSTPLQTSYYHSQPMRSLIASLARANQFDVLYIQLARMGRYLLPGAPYTQMLDFCDAFSLYHQSRAEIATSRLQGVVDNLESRRLKQWEVRLSQECDAAVAISQYDAELINTTYPPFVVPNHVEEYLSFQGISKELGPQSLVFFGEMGTYYSETALQFFVDKVLPIVWRQFPDTVLYIVGANPTLAIQRLASARVIVTGYVDDIREYVSGATISIAPLLMGSGLKNKIIQSMALGVPVVASTLANRGIGGENGRDLLVADTVEEYVRAIGQLFSTSDLRTRLTIAGKAFVQQRYSKKAMQCQLTQVLMTATERFKQRKVA